jgi:NADH-quinone oxidoreductase subunit M
MLTLILILIPLITAFILFAAGQKFAKTIALVGTLTALAFAILVLVNLKQGNIEALAFKCNWIQSLGISFSIAIDGISMLLVLLTALLTPLIVYSSFNKEYSNSHILYGLILLMQSALLGVFTSMDGFLFYIFWELALIPIYFICLVWGAEGRQKITFKFFVYTLFGSLFMLLALIYVYLQSPEKSFDIQILYQSARAMRLEQQGWVLAAFVLAFGVKMPLFPLHTWQPKTYTNAPMPGVMMLGGIMSKMATFGIIRWVLPMVPQAVEQYGNYVIVLAVVSIIYASCIAIVQKDFKYLIAYSSIAHVSLIAAGLFAMNAQGIQGGLIEMFSHGINTVGLFFVADIIFNRTHTTEMSKLGGIRGVNSQFAFLFLVVVLSAVALPFTTGFVGEFLLILGVFEGNAIAASFAGLSIILGAIYMLRAFQLMMLGETNALTLHFSKLTKQEVVTLSIIVVLIIGIGVYPKPLLDITENSVNTLLQGIK